VLCLWDTDIFSEFLRGKNPQIVTRGRAYPKQYYQPTYSIITRYEILRGLKAMNATVQLAVFETWCQQSQVLPIRDDIIVIAADIWAVLRKAGQPIGDSEPLIAATAIHHGLPLATRNVAHFSRILNLTIDDWSKP
jgi:tRNA(fMet)-specific endonuclease VapC